MKKQATTNQSEPVTNKIIMYVMAFILGTLALMFVLYGSEKPTADRFWSTLLIVIVLFFIIKYRESLFGWLLNTYFVKISKVHTDSFSLPKVEVDYYTIKLDCLERLETMKSKYMIMKPKVNLRFINDTSPLRTSTGDLIDGEHILIVNREQKKMLYFIALYQIMESQYQVVIHSTWRGEDEPVLATVALTKQFIQSYLSQLEKDIVSKYNIENYYFD